MSQSAHRGSIKFGSRPDSGNSVLVVEDDLVVRDRLFRSLTNSGFDIRFEMNRTIILDQVAADLHNAIILDVGLPDDNGVDIARAVRQRSEIPILMLTGHADLGTKLTGFDAGADDYVAKPYFDDELIARLKVLLRRKRTANLGGKNIHYIHFGSAVFNLIEGHLVGPGGTDRLTPKESKLLAVLCCIDGPLTREKTYREVFSREWDPMDRSLDVHITNLRRKLRGVCGSTVRIVTSRGEGYEFVGDRRLVVQSP